jgi:hypothetical protein
MAAVPLFRVPLEDVGGEVAMRFVESCTNELRDKVRLAAHRAEVSHASLTAALARLRRTRSEIRRSSASRSLPHSWTRCRRECALVAGCCA